MAQDLIIYLKHKENPEMQVTLQWFSTTPARTISSESGAFPYTSEKKLLPSKELHYYIESMENERAEIIRSMEKEKRSKTDLVHILTKCETTVAVNEIKESIQDSDNVLAAWQEELDDWTHWISCVRFCAEVAQDSDNSEWDLYYINC